MGLKKARNQNLALLTKLGWIMNTQEDKLWVAMLKRKYLKNHTLANWPSSRSVSHTWRSIKKTNVITQMGTKWVIGNGNDIDLWND